MHIFVLFDMLLLLELGQLCLLLPFLTQHFLLMRTHMLLLILLTFFQLFLNGENGISLINFFLLFLFFELFLLFLLLDIPFVQFSEKHFL